MQYKPHSSQQDPMNNQPLKKAYQKALQASCVRQGWVAKGQKVC